MTTSKKERYQYKYPTGSATKVEYVCYHPDPKLQARPKKPVLTTIDRDSTTPVQIAAGGFVFSNNAWRDKYRSGDTERLEKAQKELVASTGLEQPIMGEGKNDMYGKVVLQERDSHPVKVGQIMDGKQVVETTYIGYPGEAVYKLYGEDFYRMASDGRRHEV